jgi:hypothetical protein
MRIPILISSILVLLIGAICWVVVPSVRKSCYGNRKAAAKTWLAELYSLEITLHKEEQRYSSNLKRIGFELDPAQKWARAWYSIGFAKRSPDSPLESEYYYRQKAEPVNTGLCAMAGIAQPKQRDFPALMERGCPDCVAGKDTFKVGVVGNMDGKLKLMTIDQDRNWEERIIADDDD